MKLNVLDAGRTGEAQRGLQRERGDIWVSYITDDDEERRAQGEIQ